MGFISDAIVAYAQPLIDQTDGSSEQLQKAFAISQLCYNLSLVPEESRGQAITEMRVTLGLDDQEFDDFRRSIILPMIQRHQDMFPLIHMLVANRLSPSDFSPGESVPRARQRAEARSEPYPGTDRYAPCPCQSGRKYKFCCGKNRQ